MKASELQPGQFFELEGERYQKVIVASFWFAYIGKDFVVQTGHRDTEVTPLNVTGWDDEPQVVNINACDNPDGPCACGAWHSVKAGKPIAEVVEPPKLQLRESGWYLQNDGRIRGPLKHKNDGSPFVWNVRDEYGWDSWLRNGRWSECSETELDLIAEVPPPVSFNVGDRVKCVKEHSTMLNLGCVYTVHDYSTNGIRLRELPTCGWVPYDCFEQVPPPVEPEQFKAGDWVMVVSQCVFRGKVGRIAEIVSGKHDSLPVRVEFLDEGNWFGRKELRRATPAEIFAAEMREITGPVEIEPQPDADGWIEWKGGECPVDGDKKVYVRFFGGTTGGPCEAKYYWWEHQLQHPMSIAHYRLAKPEPQPNDRLAAAEVAPTLVNECSLCYWWVQWVTPPSLDDYINGSQRTGWRS